MEETPQGIELRNMDSEEVQEQHDLPKARKTLTTPSKTDMLMRQQLEVLSEQNPPQLSEETLPRWDRINEQQEA